VKLRFSIDPLTQFYIGAAVTVVSVFANGGVSMPIGLEWLAPYLKSYNTTLLQIYAPLAAYLALSTSSAPGPLSSDAAPNPQPGAASNYLAQAQLAVKS
jgi:hypothetical protein